MPKSMQLSRIVFACPSVDANFILREEIEYFIRNMEKYAEQILICLPPNNQRQEAWFDDITNPKYQVINVSGPLDRHHYYNQALVALSQAGSKNANDVLFCDYTIFGPLSEPSALIEARAASGVDALSAFSFYSTRDRQFERYKDDIKIFYETNWLQVSAETVASNAFRLALSAAAKDARSMHPVDVDAKLSKQLFDDGIKLGSYDNSIATLSSAPQWLESDRLVRGGHPILHRSIFLLDPIIYEMQTLRGSSLISAIQETTAFEKARLWRFILSVSELREVATRFEEMRVIDNGNVPRFQVADVAPNATKKAAKSLDAKKKNASNLHCALVAHVFYPDFLMEVISHFRKMPQNSTLMVSVATAEAEELVSKILDEEKITKRVIKRVEMNRGRDMSSLFITFREEFLSGKYDLALRLHSKKTPQVAPHVSNHFRTHLVENLIPDEGYVARVVDLFEQEPNIGMAIPPTIHVGFGTLGHGWFSNRDGVQRVGERLKLKVSYDKNTPLAAYGTMFWFRPSAMEPMFAERWGWEEFNPEPLHIDGGLAHIMERLMGYVVQNRGYRVMQIASRDQIVVNYLKLEYKLQLLAAQFPSGDIRQQVKMAQEYFSINTPFRERYWNRYKQIRTRIKRNNPAVWKVIRPLLKLNRIVFIDGPKRIAWRLKK